MNQGKRPSSIFASSNNNIYLDLKDVIREHALHFLPAKSLLRFTGVCRDWKFMISTPFFAHNQSYSFRTISGFFSQVSHGEPSFVSLNPMAYGVPDPSLKFLPEPVDIRSSCNGLLCCQGRTEYKAYYICNPTTKHWQKLPKPDNDHGSNPAVVLVFDPSLLNFAAEYQLICAFPSEMEGYEFEIYSSSKGSWRTSGEILFGNRVIRPNSGVYANGTVYWLTQYDKILAFDLKMERSQLMNGHGTLGVKDGKLCTTSLHGLKLSVHVLSNAYTNTMQMHSHTKAWKTHEIALDHSVFTDPYYDRDAVLFTGNDVVVFRGRDLLYVYDMKTKETKHLGHASNNNERRAPNYNERLISYVSSLVDI
ncbi:hypothetical protein LWI28_022877 [Acer negundo]|uniref:F-box associated beta-propeller type 1 domain-containing protein n=1 Tax=Acer negundo TaxID=4023 RepID=A0AAD5NM43_ACENE|nr:hypothetical protein LWI28_022877 [Acer negundo]KAK4841152.1 hypothetical protein QYF36_027362 [Acer negundo]